MTSQTKSKIYFFFKRPVNLRNRTKLKKFIEGVFRQEGRKLGSLNFVFCSDEELLGINKSYLKHDYYTDIITFELSEKGKPVEGEIYISIDRVMDNANSLGESMKTEFHRVIFHGVLHLCGYSDKSKTEAVKMKAAENKYLNQYM